MWLERWLLTLQLRVRSLFRRQAVEAELQEELGYHMDRRLEEELAHGVAPAEARRRAQLSFGGLDQHAESCRDARRVAGLEQTVYDVRYAVRVIRRNRWYALTVVCTLGLGIGATTAVFSVLDGVLLRPAPFAEVDRLVMVWGTDRASGTVREPVSVPDYLDFRAAAAGISQLAAFHGFDVNATLPGGEPVRLAAVAATRDFLPLVGVQPLLGRIFVEGEDGRGGARSVLIGETLWHRAFGRDPLVIGQAIDLNGARFTIHGVVPRGADFGVLQVLSAAAYARGFADRGDRTDVELWLPFVPDPEVMPRYLHPIFTIGRLESGVSTAEAQASFSSVAAELEQLYRVNERRGVNVEPLASVVFGPVRPALATLFAAVVLVLLIACGNVANLMLARGSTRSREVAVRTALGASGTRLARQFLIENVLLALTAAGLGIVIAIAGLQGLLALAPSSAPRIDAVGLDTRVLLFTVSLSVLVGLGFGLVPTLQSRRTNVQSVLRREGGGSSASREGLRLRSALVVAQVALAVVLLVGAGLLLRSLWNLQATDPGFVAIGLHKAEFQLPPLRYPPDDWPHLSELHQFNDALMARIAALPGVESVALTRNHPLDAGSRNSFSIVGREEESRNFPEVSIRSVSPEYFTTVGMRILAGRPIAPADRTSAPEVMVINATAARSFFPEGDAIGQRIALWGAVREIVGITSDEHIHGVDAAAPPAVYVPLAQVPPRDGNQTLLLRTQGLIPVAVAVRRVFRDMDPGLAVFGVEPMSSTLERSLRQRRFTSTLLLVFSAVAVLLALAGVHALLSYAVAQKRKEIGIRLALGARPNQIMAAIVAEGLRLSAIGLVLGMLLAVAFTRLLGSMLYGVNRFDMPSLTAAVAAITLAAGAASLLPALSARRTDACTAVKDG